MPITNIVVKNWSGQTIYVTATNGTYQQNTPEQVMITNPAIQNPLIEGTSYIIRAQEFQTPINLIYNGDLPNGDLWFVAA